ncbi:MAG: hypothetical protein A2V88_02510 [Elusimicrobia bacterium RBG_16_66_12]|nr:MAG: hypothetical protein A2V88_02510 [Elusimicrobia bacterium RBG_16_66_12]
MANDLYFEDFTEGRTFQSAARRLDEGTVRAFSEVSGDFNRIHLDEDYARSSPFGGRIAHGLLALSAATGLLHDLEILRESVVAFTGLSWKFKAPVFLGDSISLTLKVARRRAMGGRGGLVFFEAAIVTQDGKTVQEGEWTLMVKAAK